MWQNPIILVVSMDPFEMESGLGYVNMAALYYLLYDYPCNPLDQ